MVAIEDATIWLMQPLWLLFLQLMLSNHTRTQHKAIQCSLSPAAPRAPATPLPHSQPQHCALNGHKHLAGPSTEHTRLPVPQGYPARIIPMALPGGAPLTSLQPPSLHPGHRTAQLSPMQVTCSAGTDTLLSLRKA